MPPIHIIKAFLEQATGINTRSTVLKSLSWLLVIMIAATITAFTYELPYWMGTSFFVASMLSVVLYLFTYIYCLFKDRDALRSETYIIHKMAIERGLLGDNMTGLFKPSEEPGLLLGPAKTAMKEDLP